MGPETAPMVLFRAAVNSWAQPDQQCAGGESINRIARRLLRRAHPIDAQSIRFDPFGSEPRLDVFFSEHATATHLEAVRGLFALHPVAKGSNWSIQPSGRLPERE